MESTLQSAVTLHQQGHLDDALREYRLLAENSQDANLFYLMGNCLAQKRLFSEAIPILNRAITLDKKLEDAYLNLAICQEEDKQLDGAELTLKEGLKRFPNNKRLHNRIGSIQLTNDQPKSAITHFQQAIQLDHQFIPAYINLANAYEKLDMIDEAVEILRSAQNQSESNPDIRNNLANLLRQKGEYIEATQLLEININNSQQLAESHHNMGLILQDNGDVAGAQQHYQLSLQSNPNNLLSLWNYNLLQLMLGNWDDSLNKYGIGKLIGERPTPPSSIPEWAGEDLNGKRLLILHEQGIGEEILFSSVYHLLPRENTTITAICDPRLVDLFSHSFEWIKFYPSTLNNLSIENFDYYVLAGDLPFILNTNQSNLHSTAFLKTQRNSYHVQKDGSNKKRIGISWKGGKNQNEEQKRSIKIEELNFLLKTEDYVFVNLQHNADQEELDELRTVCGHFETSANIDLKNDLDKVSELIQSLDAVVCCSNSISHFSGALNIPTYMLTPVSPTWYWMIDRKDSLWYPNLHLVRQEKLGSWDKEIEHIRLALRDIELL